MKLHSTAMAMLCAAGLLPATLVFAQQPKDKPKKATPAQPSAAAKAQPKVAVVANAQVNISTQVNIGSPSNKPTSPEERKHEGGKEASPSDLLLAMDQASQRGAAVVVIANVKIDVSTSVNINPSSATAPPAAPPKEKAPPKKPVATAASNTAASNTPVNKSAVSNSPANKSAVSNAPASTAPVNKSGGSKADDKQQAEDLFELHVRLRRTRGGVDVLLAGTVPSADGARTAAERINQVREHGMLGLLVLPLIVKGDPDMQRGLRTAWGSIKAEASGARLTLTASVPHEIIAVAAKFVDAVRQWTKDMLGQR